MAVTTVLGDTRPDGLQLDVKFGMVRKIYFNAAIGATGAITVTAAATSGGTTAGRTSAGLYALASLPSEGARTGVADGL